MDNSTLLLHRIAITQLEGIGSIIAKNLIAYAGGEEEVLRLPLKKFLDIPGIGHEKAEICFRSIPSALKRAEKEIQFLEQHRIQALHYTDQNYPALLKECADSPILLYQRGNFDLHNKKILSVVGTRKATDYGKRMIHQIIGDLCDKHPDLVIVSGLAYGVDIAAHKEALEHHTPTIGMMASGFSILYPQEHKPIAVKMLENGGLMTEFASYTSPLRQNFLMRNRIIAGIAHATLVIESARQGGSLITANMAGDYDRDVFACPGRLDDAQSTGCNALIKTHKANLVECATDIEYIMGWDHKHPTKSSYNQPVCALSPEEEALHVLLRGFDRIHLDEIVRLTNDNVHVISARLLTMEFKGVVRCYPGNLYAAI